MRSAPNTPRWPIIGLLDKALVHEDCVRVEIAHSSKREAEVRREFEAQYAVEHRHGGICFGPLTAWPRNWCFIFGMLICQLNQSPVMSACVSGEHACELTVAQAP